MKYPNQIANIAKAQLETCTHWQINEERSNRGGQREVVLCCGWVSRLSLSNFIDELYQMLKQKGNSHQNGQSKYRTRYNPHEIMDNSRDLSPWGSMDEYRKHFRPSQYYQTISKQHKMYNRSLENNLLSLPVNLNNHPFANRVTKDFAHLVKLQRKGAFMHCQERRSGEYPLKRNLVMVSLQDNPQDSQEKPNQTALQNKSKHSDFKAQKEQPMHVKIFKKLKQKNKVKKQDMEQDGHISLLYEGEKQKSVNQHGHVYQVMPKRSLRLTNYRQKILNSSYESTKNDFLPKIGKQRSGHRQEKASHEMSLFCKGEIISKIVDQKQVKNESILSFQECSSYS